MRTSQICLPWGFLGIKKVFVHVIGQGQDLENSACIIRLSKVTEAYVVLIKTDPGSIGGKQFEAKGMDLCHFVDLFFLIYYVTAIFMNKILSYELQLPLWLDMFQLKAMQSKLSIAKSRLTGKSE